MSRIEEELKATGFAQVIAVLKPPAAPARARRPPVGLPGARRPPCRTWRGPVRAMEKYFTLNANTRQGALAQSMRTATRGVGARGTRPGWRGRTEGAGLPESRPGARHGGQEGAGRAEEG